MSDHEFEERADQLTIDDITTTMADAEVYVAARKKLLARGAKLLVGPRGTGKTHLMRFTYAESLKTKSNPVVLYANFNRYLTLEPLLLQSADAVQKFQAWVLAKLLIAAHTYASDTNIGPLELPAELGDLGRLVALLEKGAGEAEYLQFGQRLTIDDVHLAVGRLIEKTGRGRAVLLLDDAALTLADRYLEEFFRLFRLLKSENISPKASVYPGSTQYGPTFHAAHEVEMVQLWISPTETSEYSKLMGDIGLMRLGAQVQTEITPELNEILKFMAFGVPRAYLRLVREYLGSKAATAQSRINQVVERHVELTESEYSSLKIKIPQFASIIEVGWTLFESILSALRKAPVDPAFRQITIGIQRPPATSPLWDRMVKFLVEVGVLHPLRAVSHGPDRKYDRYIVHLAFLYNAGLFRTGKGWSAKDVADSITKPDSKHPLRSSQQTLLDGGQLAAIKLNLPPCTKCSTPRLNDSQLYCHHCGTQLVKTSHFEECMKLDLKQVPGISKATAERIKSQTGFKTIGDVYASQNPAGELQAADYIGTKRALGIVNSVRLAVEEFLS